MNVESQCFYNRLDISRMAIGESVFFFFCNHNFLLELVSCHDSCVAIIDRFIKCPSTIKFFIFKISNVDRKIDDEVRMRENAGTFIWLEIYSQIVKTKKISFLTGYSKLLKCRTNSVQ